MQKQKERRLGYLKLNLQKILLKFDLPTVLDSLQLAKIKESEKNKDIFCYHIYKYGEGDKSPFGIISVSKLEKSIVVLSARLNKKEF
ncbi:MULTISPECIES: hypothetical protein [unclassified Clostridium]|uniref:hypothetical protein n=1 Tax=unclassified Clostridium TaxID=2614128 RepID=UPI00061F6659|nr:MULTISPECIES: hypothetical protein [unclassified Clostridium]KJZ88408.1 hypothetical protein ClosIBUN125C_CONTIG22g01377 [Clostridium sp. IBUN125C]KJZ92283.1 hypothetical protein ClosIBUN13A_CONTIG220g03433 [Clostridium sp. IBUN13A]KJZ94977.1 hypothetical protein ClosIBUN22A_CONTIG135g02694 [Clostridium sp. IBUN22A]KJZ95683.1 hypothetical protein ClosIBUN62F_CONTIG13g00706 [Clostridium sp. IBUN62F]